MRVSYDEFLKFKTKTKIGKKLPDNIFQRHSEYTEQREKIENDYCDKLNELNSQYNSNEMILSDYIRHYRRELKDTRAIGFYFGLMFTIPFIIVMLSSMYINWLTYFMGGIGISSLIISLISTMKYIKIK